MSRHGAEAKAIFEAFETLAEACENIRDYDQCENCPMKYMCLDDTEESVNTMAELKDASSWEEFLDYSENAEMKKVDRDAAHADFMRKYEAEERLMERWDD